MTTIIQTGQNPQPFTRDQLANAVLAKVPFMAWPPTQEEIAQAIKSHGLESVVCPGTRPPLSFSASFTWVYGKRLK